MKNKLSRKTIVVLATSLSLAGTGGSATGAMAQAKEKSGIVAEGRYYCNVKALTAPERERHASMTKKLLEKRRETVETEKGYEFQYDPADMTVAEVAEWVVAESKCCPFFDFHIDLENEGRLVCLRLTGKEGVKQFIRAEFGVR
jgi:hypothetical protein